MLKLSPMRTISFAFPPERMRELRRQLREAGYDERVDGDVIEFSVDDQKVVFAIQHPTGQYMLRACPEVIQTQEQESDQ